MSVSTILERQIFKAVPGGYVFQPPPPTAFYNTSAYQVSESQKADILAIYSTGSAMRVRLVTATAVALAVAAAWLLHGAEAPAVFVAFVFVMVWIVAQVLGFCLFLSLKLRELGPVLANLPHSKERLFQFRGREALFGAPSPFFIALYSAGFGFWLGIRFLQHPPFADATSTVVLFGLALNMFWAAKAQQKWRSAAKELRHGENSP
jgi:hypothetical protein